MGALSIPAALLILLQLISNSAGQWRLWCDYTSFFVVDVVIEPPITNGTLGVSCQTTSQQEKIKNMIRNVIDKHFVEYLHQSFDLHSVELEELCEVAAASGGKGDIQKMKEKQQAAPRSILWTSPEWKYSTTSQCRFCVPEFDAIKDPDKPAEPLPSTEERLQEKEQELQRKLETRITRTLTKRLNKNKLSCLEGSNSTVIVNLTPVGDERPPSVCQEQDST